MPQEKLEFTIGGMHCAACSARIEKVVGGLPEVAEVSVSLATDTARLSLREGVPGNDAASLIADTVKNLGFTATLLERSGGAGADLGRMELAIGGMHCASCSARIERVVGALPEVRNISVSLATNTAQLALNEGVAVDSTAALITGTIAGLGFTAEVLRPAGGGAGGLSEAAARWEKRSADQQAEMAARRRELLPAFAFALPLLIFSMGEMLGMPLPAFLSSATSPFRFALVQLLLCLPVMYSGRRFFQLGLPALLRRSPTMDTLVALGTGAAFLYSLWNTLVAAMPPEWQQHFLSAGAAARTQVREAATSPHVQEEAAGLWNMLFGSGHMAHGVELYYESAAVVIALVSLGKYLEARSRLRTAEAMKGLLDLAPETAVRIVTEMPGHGLADPSGRQYETVPLAEVREGDLLQIRPGARVPVDGAVLEGSSFVDESMLTGESMPVEKSPGDPLAGGTMNQQGALIMRAERVGADTVLARIVRLVQEAQGSKAPIAGMADRVSLYFVPAVMAVAAAAGIFWWGYDGSAAFALRIFVSVMVIACPCAMGLATPMSIMVGTGRGAQLGVLFKNGLALEQSSRITSMVFDKTGTLTKGKPALADVLPLDNFCPDPAGAAAFPIHPDDLLRIAASLEVSSEHPLARALVEGAVAADLSLLPVEDFAAHPGKGVRGMVTMPSGPVSASLGNAVFAREQADEYRRLHPDISCASAPDSPEKASEDARSLETALTDFSSEGKTPVALLLNGVPAAVFAVADPLRDEAVHIIAELRHMGISSIMLTGDNRGTAEAVARRAGITRVIAEVLPDGKEQAVAALQQQGEVVGMVGDGVNDAPALARADVGFAMSSGIDVAVETGDVVLMRHGLSTVLTALALGRATMRNIRENLFWAFAYNVIGIPFAAGVFHFFGGPVLSPMLAGAAMALSSVSVVTNALRLRFFNEKKKSGNGR